MGFKEAIELALKHEGYYSNNPLDRGGATKFGITMATLSIYRKGPVSEAMVKALTLDEALKVYEALYWRPLMLDKVRSDALAAIILDQAINRGVAAVTKRLQRLLGVEIDGIMGPQTIAAINSCEPRPFGIRFVFDSQMAYCDICVKDPSQLQFLRGWIKRSQELLLLLA